MQDYIRIRGARVHNLKNISLSIPHNQFTVITGVSGSGKSSLAFDTIYAEGQRRYVESLSAYARQFLERMEKPDVDEIDGIAPAVAIRQKNTTRNPRSTVATSTECFDFLRLLFARVGPNLLPDLRHAGAEGHGGRGGRARAGAARGVALVRPVSVPANTRGDAALRDRLFELRKNGFNRLFQNGRLFEFSTPESLLDIDFAKPVFVLVDRIAIAPDLHQRLVDTIEICYRESGEVIFEAAVRAASACASASASSARPATGNSRTRSRSCSASTRRSGACPRCQGFGNTIDFDMNRVIPDPTLSVEGGAVDPWTKPKYRSWLGNFKKHAPKFRLQDAGLRFDATPSARRWTTFIRRFFDHLESKKYKLHVRVFLSRYRGYAQCPECRGARLRKEALYVRVGREEPGRDRAHEHRRGAAVLRRAGTDPRRDAASPRRSWWRSGSG